MTPETHETVTFDAEGVCNVCRQHEHKKTAIDWTARHHELDELVAEYKGRFAYDCIVPFSGGKDSTFTLYYLVKKYGLKPLVVQFDHGFMRPRLEENNVRTFKKLGVDVLSFRPNWHVVRKVMLESLKRKGDFCWHCHTGIFAYPMQIAVKFEVPLLFWGEPSAEYTSYYGYDETEEVDERRFNRFVNLGITADDMTGMIDMSGLDPRDLNPFRYPALKQLRKLRVRSVCLGSYVPWDVKAQVELVERELGWKGNVVEGVPEGYDYEKIECFMKGVRDYLKFLKRGYSRTAHLTSLDIRNGRMTRKRALELVEEHDGKRPASLDVFLRYVDITEDEFHDIAKSHAVAPWVCDHGTLKQGAPLHDFDQMDVTFEILPR
jgi:N-acetyl sugar amidotransferase